MTKSLPSRRKKKSWYFATYSKQVSISPLDHVLVEILQAFGIYLHQLTSDSIVRLSPYLWLTKTCKFVPSTDHFTFIHKVHHQSKVLSVQTPEGQELKAETQYGCYNFTYKDLVSSPVTAYKNKWSVDWTSYWFYHQVPLNKETQGHPHVIDWIRNLGNTP